MVKLVRDSTGRFPERPYYTTAELDRECEALVAKLIIKRYGEVRPRIATDELSLLIEQNGAGLDSSVDLAYLGDDVEGVTVFHPDAEPEVMISERLAGDARRENRLRTTMAHEFGHVHFHRYLWADKLSAGCLFDRTSAENKAICKRDSILNARKADWMEWQAGYVSGAILMPASLIRRLVSDYCEARGLHGAVALISEHGRAIVGMVTETFQVSEEAARVRLQKLGLLASSDRQSSLFD
jgi:Zn-dependent peptidase ImmA (M78 family)